MKYFLLNDIEYLFHKRWQWILLFFLFPALLCIIHCNPYMTGREVLVTSLGLSLEMDNLSLLELLSYLFCLSFFAFLVFDCYVKDIKYRLDTIFLRMNMKTWYIKKTIVFLGIMFVFLLVLFGLLYGVLKGLGFGLSFSELFSLFLLFYLYISLVQVLLLGLYFLFILSKTGKIISFILALLLCIFFPKNILSCTEGSFLFFVLIALIHYGLSLCIQKNRSTYIEESEVV